MTIDYIVRPRGGGKTTEMIDRVIELVGGTDRPAIILCPHIVHARVIVERLKAAGLVDVEFMSVTEAISGRLDGRVSVVAVDNFDDVEDGWRLLRELQRHRTSIAILTVSGNPI